MSARRRSRLPVNDNLFAEITSELYLIEMSQSTHYDNVNDVSKRSPWRNRIEY